MMAMDFQYSNWQKSENMGCHIILPWQTLTSLDHDTHSNKWEIDNIVISQQRIILKAAFQVKRKCFL